MPNVRQLFDAARLELVFSKCFELSERTVLVGGALEPSYEPVRDEHAPAKLAYREDYFASALHEASHWCIAGAIRRQQHDFGYWYAPEGRSAKQQQAFEAVEVKPQALEWFFSRACGYRFQVSVDNFDAATGQLPNTQDFCTKVVAQATYWQVNGLPSRAANFYTALCTEFSTYIQAQNLVFGVEDIQ